jgi:ATP-dependent DNA helicase PIF1
MVLRNINPKRGLCNGTRLKVINMHKTLLECEILTGEQKGNIEFIPRISCKPTEGSFPFNFSRRQFPVKVCYGMTINKSQGQSIDMVGLDLEDDVFVHSQTYVGFSRVKSYDRIRVKVNKDKGPNKVKNIVWKEALL